MNQLAAIPYNCNNEIVYPFANFLFSTDLFQGEIENNFQITKNNKLEKRSYMVQYDEIDQTVIFENSQVLLCANRQGVQLITLLKNNKKFYLLSQESTEKITDYYTVRVHNQCFYISDGPRVVFVYNPTMQVFMQGTSLINYCFSIMNEVNYDCERNILSLKDAEQTAIIKCCYVSEKLAKLKIVEYNKQNVNKISYKLNQTKITCCPIRKTNIYKLIDNGVEVICELMQNGKILYSMSTDVALPHVVHKNPLSIYNNMLQSIAVI